MKSYVKRHAEATVRQLARMFGSILVTGPRQVGKTTMLRQITGEMNYVSLDDLIVRTAAQEESGTFFKDNPPRSLSTRYKKHPLFLSRSNSLRTANRKKGSFI